MKWIFTLTFGSSLILLLLTGCHTLPLDSPEVVLKVPVETDDEWVFDWDQVEARIIELSNQALRDDNTSELYRLKSKIVSIHTGENDHRASSREYWTAVLNTNLVSVEQERGESAQEARLIDESIELLEKTSYQLVERNALLAILYRIKIDHDQENRFELFLKMQDALDAAIDADPTNLRVLLAQVFIGTSPVHGFSIDLDIEESIDAALAPTSAYENIGDALTPTWGLPQIYALAISRTMEAEQLNEASELITQAVEKFPDDYRIGYWARLFQIEPRASDP